MQAAGNVIRRRPVRSFHVKLTGRIPDWLDFVYRRDLWMAEYANFATACVKAVKPNVTIEHQFSRITGGWVDGSSELLAEAIDYCGGDYYGGFCSRPLLTSIIKMYLQTFRSYIIRQDVIRSLLIIPPRRLKKS